MSCLSSLQAKCGRGLFGLRVQLLLTVFVLGAAVSKPSTGASNLLNELTAAKKLPEAADSPAQHPQQIASKRLMRREKKKVLPSEKQAADLPAQHPQQLTATEKEKKEVVPKERKLMRREKKKVVPKKKQAADLPAQHPLQLTAKRLMRREKKKLVPNGKQALLNERSARLENTAQRKSLPPSLLQTSSVASHWRPENPSHAESEPERNTIAPAPSPHKQVPDWQKYALNEDGTPNIQKLISETHPRDKPLPRWARAGLAQEDLLTNIDKEMARLGVEQNRSLRKAIAEHEARVAAYGTADGDKDDEDKEDGDEDGEAAVPLPDEVTKGGYPDGPTAPPKPIWRDPFAFRFYRFTPVKVRDKETADAVSLAEIKLGTFNNMVPTLGAQAYNAFGRNPEDEKPQNALDGSRETVWTDYNMGSLVIILEENVVMTEFQFTTGHEHPERDPVQWYFEGSHDMQHWKVLVEQLSDAAVPSARKSDTDFYNWRVDCMVSDWHGWSKCNQNCSGGNQTRVRGVERHSWNDGKCDNDWFQLQPCNERPCDGPIVKGGARRGGHTSVMFWSVLAAIGWQFVAES